MIAEQALRLAEQYAAGDLTAEEYFAAIDDLAALAALAVHDELGHDGGGKRLPFDLHHDAITVAQAAWLADVTEDVIRQWKSRGHLAAVDTDREGRPLFRGVDVLRAQAEIPRKRRRRKLREGTVNDGELTESA